MNDAEPITRFPAVAGRFYPADPGEILTQARALLSQAASALDDLACHPRPKALIVPHAGWMWSGDLAALGWQTLAPYRDEIRRVVLLGPTHYVAIRGVALPEADWFATPLGALPIPVAEVQRATADLGCPLAVNSATHADEHALEVQVPFVQQVLGEVELVPLNVGMAEPAEVSDVIEALWGGTETVVAVSTDLSHYLPYHTACLLDSQTIERVLSVEGPVAPDLACGASPLNGLLEVCRRRGLQPRLLGSHNSGDVSGGHDRVVGYAALYVEEP